MGRWTRLEDELVSACQERPTSALPVVSAQEGWLEKVQDFLKEARTLPPGPALLVSGPDGIRRVPLQGSLLTLGRAADCTVRLPYQFVSREHCRLQLEGDQWTVEDLGSTNGTWVNGIDRDNAPLLAGDILQVGVATILFLPPERGIAPEPPA